MMPCVFALAQEYAIMPDRTSELAQIYADVLHYIGILESQVEQRSKTIKHMHAVHDSTVDYMDKRDADQRKEMDRLQSEIDNLTRSVVDDAAKIQWLEAEKGYWENQYREAAIVIGSTRRCLNDTQKELEIAKSGTAHLKRVLSNLVIKKLEVKS